MLKAVNSSLKRAVNFKFIKPYKRILPASVFSNMLRAIRYSICDFELDIIGHHAQPQLINTRFINFPCAQDLGFLCSI